jgi:hydrogenase/urease accessory protein HupE
VRSVLLLFCIIAAGFLTSAAEAHDVRPGYLEIRQTTKDTYDLLFKVPAVGEELRLGLYLNLPKDIRDVMPRRASFDGGAYIERRKISRDEGLVEQTISIDGLAATFTDVLVRFEDLRGTTQTERLTPTKTSFTIKAAPGTRQVAVTYLQLGIEHILGGLDHLLFILALILLVGDWRQVAITATAFTLAHSITLAAATLGFIHVPGPPVEATIALSIMVVAAEIVNMRRGRLSFASQWPWLVAFAFGLLHGFGFAGALAEVGLPQHAIPLALLFFNLGVEAGQLAFIAAVMALAWMLQFLVTRLHPKPAKEAMARVHVFIAYGIGALSAYWLIDRSVGFFA